jgi:hypothetical protein
MFKTIKLVLVLLSLLAVACSNRTESGAIIVHDPVNITMSALWRINDYSMSANWHINAPSIGGSRDAVAFTTIMKERLNTLTNNIINVQATSEYTFIQQIDYTIIINRQLRFLSVVINNQKIINGEEINTIEVSKFRTTNGRLVRFNDVFRRNSEQLIVAEVNHQMRALAVTHNASFLNNITIENLNEALWYFDDENLLVVFNTIVVNGKPLEVNIPIEFFTRNSLLR